METSKVQYSLVRCMTMRYDMEQCHPLRYSVIYCGAVAQYSLWRCSVLQCGTDRCWTPLVLSGTQHHMLLHFVIQVSQCNVQSHALLYITAHHRMVLCATMQFCVQRYMVYPASCATISYCSLHMAIRKQLQMFIVIHGWYIWASMCLSCISFWICGPQWQFVALTLQPIVTVCVALSLWPKVTACVALTLWTAVIVCSTDTVTHRDTFHLCGNCTLWCLIKQQYLCFTND